MAIAPAIEARPATAADDRAPTTPRWRTLAILGAIVALALGLRLWGLSPDRGFHYDERLYAAKAERMLDTGNPHPRYFLNPSLLTYVIAGELLAARASGLLAVRPTADGPRPAFPLARLTGALLGTATVALAFATGAALFGRRVGLLAAALLGAAFLHVRDSHYGVNDVPSAALLALSACGAARLLRQPALRWYLLAGLAGGLATSTKYTAGFFFAPLLAAHWLACRGPGRRPYDRRALLALALAGAAGLGGYLLGTPYTLLDFELFWRDFREQHGLGGQPSWGQPEGPVPLLYLSTLLQGFGALPLALALVGLALAWRRRRAEALLLLAFPVAYLLFMLPKAVFYPRLAIPLLPFCAVLAGYGAATLAGRLPPRWRAAGLAALLVAALAQPLANDVLHNRVLTRTDTRILAGEWVRANLPTGRRVAAEEDSLVMPADGARPGGQFLKLEGGEQLSDLAARGVEYVVVNSFFYGRDAGREGYRRLHRGLEERAELIAVIGPGIGGQEVPFRKEDVVASPFWAVEEYERLGPTVRVYSLASPAGGG